MTLSTSPLNALTSQQGYLYAYISLNCFSVLYSGTAVPLAFARCGAATLGFNACRLRPGRRCRGPQPYAHNRHAAK